MGLTRDGEIVYIYMFVTRLLVLVVISTKKCDKQIDQQKELEFSCFQLLGMYQGKLDFVKMIRNLICAILFHFS